MNKNFAIAIIVLIVALGAGWYVWGRGGSYSQPVTQPQPSIHGQSQPSGNAQSSTSGQASDTATISVSNFAFSPATMAVKVGTKVTWTNNDSVPHTITSDTSGAFDSAQVAPGKTFSYTFTTPGTFAYHCSIHPGMHGTITVQ